ncbi:MAG: efflux RND transporter permease subunit [Hyphomicrobiales bacterium]|nr:efflux RND transporter permease subunit [Hyphomicrobiales bacterium]MDE2113707.1 efflux RND transporter permease subunit [Hyphomicrobiales bacterium]
MGFFQIFIHRPIGTVLLAIGLFLTGVLAYFQLPVASLPSVDLPIIFVSASRAGADPQTMAATVAAPLERYLGTIAGITEMTSTSSLGNSRIILQFDLSRNVVAAARDVQAALNNAATDLPSDLPTLPVSRKINPNAAPVLILALTSKNISASALYDVADSVLAQRIAQVKGVAQVSVTGAQQPAIRVTLDPARLAAMAVTTDQVRTTIVNANSLGPLGALDGVNQQLTIGSDAQLLQPQDYENLVVKNSKGVSVRLGDIATIAQGVRSTRSYGTFNGQPSVVLLITQQAGANVIDTVNGVKNLLPTLQRFIPAGVDVSVLNDRTVLIRSSITDMEITILITVALVMLVIFLFLRRVIPTLAAGITVPLALAGTCSLMLAAGFTLDNLSLMALAVSVGFVVDDAIVIIENVESKLALGMTPMQAAIQGTRQIGFTVLSISISLFAAFIPLLFLGGIMGKFFREFAVTLTFAIGISTMVSLTLTPTICAHLIRREENMIRNGFDRVFEHSLEWVIRHYLSSLRRVIGHPFLTMMTLVAAVALTVGMFRLVPKGAFPQVETGLITAHTQANTDISFPAMLKLQKSVADIIGKDPAVDGYSSSIDTSAFSSSVNQGRMFINLKSPDARGGLTVTQVIGRLRKKLSHLIGIQTFLVPANAFGGGGRAANSQYQFTLWDADFNELVTSSRKVVDALKSQSILQDVNTDRNSNGLQATVNIDRIAAARLGVSITNIDTALNNAFSQRQISTLYNPRNQYTVVLEVNAQSRKGPADLSRIFVPGANGVQVPLTSVASLTTDLAPLEVNHQGQFPAITISYALKSDSDMEAATNVIVNTVASLHLPTGVHTQFAGDAQDFIAQKSDAPLLVAAALISIYLVLGILYESLIHPLTILSTLPSAALGALLAIWLSGTTLSIISLIGIILLIGIVKKNGIMLVDFAIHAKREGQTDPKEAIISACKERFRPILMTTLASLLGALPLILASGPGYELRRPLGITIAGGLLVSQVLTLYTTPVTYLLLDRLSQWRISQLWRRSRPVVN